MIVGSQGKKCRLIGVRASAAVARKRRAQRRKKAQESGKSPCQKGLIRDGWHLMLTNLSSKEATVTQLVAVYRSRWAVEIQFRAWKQSLNLDKALNRKSNVDHMQALVIPGMIAHQLGMKMASHLGDRLGRARIRDEKLYDLFAVFLIRSPKFTELTSFSPDARHLSRCERVPLSPIESGILALS